MKTPIKITNNIPIFHPFSNSIAQNGERRIAINTGIYVFIAVMGAVLAFMAYMNHHTLDNIKAKNVGNGQHGNARWATAKELTTIYNYLPFTPKQWRKGINRPEIQGTILGYRETPPLPRLVPDIKKTGDIETIGKKLNFSRKITALVDTDDVHTLMIAASGAGKTACFTYPNIEYALACGMSFLVTDTKGDVYRNTATIAEKYYDFNVGIIDLRNPMKSHGINMLNLVNHYMDLYLSGGSLTHKAKAERYAKITAKTIIHSTGQTEFGQNAYFYDTAESIITTTILLLAEFCPPGYPAYYQRL